MESENLICMLCGKSPDALTEEDEYGNWWIYCKACDCWTEHPPVPSSPTT